MVIGDAGRASRRSRMPALESNLVESVVDPRRPEISPEQLLREVADQRHGEDAVRDG